MLRELYFNVKIVKFQRFQENHENCLPSFYIFNCSTLTNNKKNYQREQLIFTYNINSVLLIHIAPKKKKKN